jgi:hypothetical protein
VRNRRHLSPWRVDSSGVYICKSVVNDLRHGNFICKSEGKLPEITSGPLIPNDFCIFLPSISNSFSVCEAMEYPGGGNEVATGFVKDWLEILIVEPTRPKE